MFFHLLRICVLLNNYPWKYLQETFSSVFSNSGECKSPCEAAGLRNILGIPCIQGILKIQWRRRILPRIPGIPGGSDNCNNVHGDTRDTAREGSTRASYTYFKDS